MTCGPFYVVQCDGFRVWFCIGRVDGANGNIVCLGIDRPLALIGGVRAESQKGARTLWKEVTNVMIALIEKIFLAEMEEW